MTQGESSFRILTREILPNATGPLVVDFCLRLGYTAIIVGDLGFLGLGLPPPFPDWGGYGERRPRHGLRLSASRDLPLRRDLIAGAGAEPAGRWLARRIGPRRDGKMSDAPILVVDGLHVALPKGADRPYAVENISLTLKRREILCIVGESGSGKSVLASAVMGAAGQGPPAGGRHYQAGRRRPSRNCPSARCAISAATASP